MMKFNGENGKRGAIGICPRCGKSGEIVWSWATDVSKCKCGWSNEPEAKQMNSTWVITENGCVITCPNCGKRLELCYPDGTEVRYLPHCPYCGKKLEEIK